MTLSLSVKNWKFKNFIVWGRCILNLHREYTWRAEHIQKALAVGAEGGPVRWIRVSVWRSFSSSHHEQCSHGLASFISLIQELPSSSMGRLLAQSLWPLTFRKGCAHKCLSSSLCRLRRCTHTSLAMAVDPRRDWGACFPCSGKRLL